MKCVYRTTLAIFSIAGTISFTQSVAAQASPIVEDDSCELIIASMHNFGKAIEFIDDHFMDRTQATIFQSENGAYAISAGNMLERGSRRKIAELKHDKIIPSDSFCARTKLVAIHDTETGAIIASTDKYRTTGIETASSNLSSANAIAQGVASGVIANKVTPRDLKIEKNTNESAPTKTARNTVAKRGIGKATIGRTLLRGAGIYGLIAGFLLSWE